MSFYSSKIRIRPADKAFSEFVRKRDGECQFKVKCFGHQLFKELQCAHYHSRRKESVRFDPDNAIALCPACHQFADTTAEGKKYFDQFMLKRLGEQRCDLLQLRAESPTKPDDKMTIIVIKQLIRELEATSSPAEMSF